MHSLRLLALALVLVGSFAALAQASAPKTSRVELARELPGDEGSDAEG
jgi:hypothetical protein